MIKALDLGHPKIAELKVTYEVTVFASYLSCNVLFLCSLTAFFSHTASFQPVVYIICVVFLGQTVLLSKVGSCTTELLCSSVGKTPLRNLQWTCISAASYPTWKLSGEKPWPGEPRGSKQTYFPFNTREPLDVLVFLGK